jgi:DNA-binding FadR family transcriptional regulator
MRTSGGSQGDARSQGRRGREETPVVTQRFDRITVSPAYLQVAESIEQQIVSGRLRPGDPIGTEAALVRQFGVNRSTVREGLRLLEQSGLLQRDSSRRLRAGLPRRKALAARISNALALTEVTFLELWETLLALEPVIAELAAERARPALIERLDENLAWTEAAAEDPDRLAQLDTEFHALVAEAAGNRVAQLAREPTGLLIYPATAPIFAAVPEAAPRLLAAHRHVVDAMRSRDRALAGLWMRRHIVDFRKGFVRSGGDLDGPVARRMPEIQEVELPPEKLLSPGA